MQDSSIFTLEIEKYEPISNVVIFANFDCGWINLLRIFKRLSKAPSKSIPMYAETLTPLFMQCAAVIIHLESKQVQFLRRMNKLYFFVEIREGFTCR